MPPSCPAKALSAFLEAQIEATKAEGTLFSIHLKATMMKVSDPIIFGHAVKAYLKPVFAEYGDAFAAAGINANSGHGRGAGSHQGLAARC